jgi:hypothetical protein
MSDSNPWGFDDVQATYRTYGGRAMQEQLLNAQVHWVQDEEEWERKAHTKANNDSTHG